MKHRTAHALSAQKRSLKFLRMAMFNNLVRQAGNDDVGDDDVVVVVNGESSVASAIAEEIIVTTSASGIVS